MITDRPLIIGHRGLADENVENSLSAIQDSNDKCDMIEVDIRQTADDRFVLFHDKTLDRSSNASLSIEDLTYNELLNYKLFGSDQHIISLGEAVKSIEIPILAEIKKADDIEAIVNSSSRTHYQSFDPYILQEVRRYVSSSLGVICGDDSYDAQTDTDNLLRPLDGIDFVFDELTGTFVSVPYKLVTEDIINYAHDKNIAVFVWDLSLSDQVEEMRKLDVDGLIVDSVDIL